MFFLTTNKKLILLHLDAIAYDNIRIQIKKIFLLLGEEVLLLY
jgi:hypothetical protein